MDAERDELSGNEKRAGVGATAAVSCVPRGMGVVADVTTVFVQGEQLAGLSSGLIRSL
jgi:hypothetical protein